MSTEPDLGILLQLATRGFAQALYAELGERGFADLRPAYGVVFRALGAKPLTLTELAARLGVTKQSAAKVVNELEGKDLLQRTGSATDGRAKVLELTPRGLDAMATAIAVSKALRERLRAEVGPDELRSMDDTLRAFVELTGFGDELARRTSIAVWDES